MTPDELERWWRSRSVDERRVMLTLREGQTIPLSLSGPIVAAGLANSGATFRRQDGLALDRVSGTLGNFLDRKRGECAVLDCTQAAGRIVTESGEVLPLLDAAGDNALLHVDPDVTVCFPACDRHDFQRVATDK
jgi:hypothetical protein